MEVTGRIELSPELLSEEELKRYLQATIVTTHKGAAFSKLGILSDLVALFRVSSALSRVVHSTTDYICAMAPSGIPLAVAVSQQLQKPLVFFNPQGWERYGISTLVRPELREQSRVTLVDAHLRTGMSSTWCQSYLASRFASTVSNICTPIVFEDCLRSPFDLPIRSFADTTRAAKAISVLTEQSVDQIINMIKDLQGPFWSYPPSLGHNFNEYRARNPNAKLVDYAMGAVSIVARLRNYPKTSTISASQSLLLGLPYVQSRQLDLGVWEIMRVPEVLQQLCEIVGKEMNISQYSYLIGVGHLGLAMAVAIAYHNQDAFRGRIVAWLGEYGLLPPIRDFDDDLVLPVTMRVQFGTYLMDALREIRPRNGQVNQVLVGIRDFNTNNVFERLRQLSLSRLHQLDIELVCLC